LRRKYIWGYANEKKLNVTEVKDIFHLKPPATQMFTFQLMSKTKVKVKIKLNFTLQQAKKVWKWSRSVQSV
jgi:hypothetical protein